MLFYTFCVSDLIDWMHMWCRNVWLCFFKSWFCFFFFINRSSLNALPKVKINGKICIFVWGREGQFMLTFICQAGIKSALCRTLSKILCSWGLMKELSEENIMGSCQKNAWKTSDVWIKEGHLNTFSSDAVVKVCTLNAEHLSYLECSPTDLAQCVDNSLSIGLWQERRV